MSANKRAQLKQWLESGKALLQPLSFPQREIWETSPVPAGDVANHICCLINVRGEMTPDSCAAAVQGVVDRQEVLRLSILPGKDRPLQMIRQDSPANFRFRELSPAQADMESVEEIAAEIFSEPFDLVQGPLYRTEVLQRSKTEHMLVMAIHHAIADGWSLGVFVQDLCISYIQELMGRREPLPPVPLSYAAWGAAERSFWTPAEVEQRAGFWRPKLAGSKRIWNSLDETVTASGAPDRWVSYLPADLTTAVQDLARASGTTLFNTLLAAFQIALSRWTGETDIVVGTPVANRNMQTVRETMGYCAGIVPLRGQVESDRTFSANLQTVHDDTVDAFANAMPFAELVPAIGAKVTPGHNPIFDVRFALQNHPVPDIDLDGLSAHLSMRSTGTARFVIACEVTIIGDGLEVVWRFRSKLFPRSEIEDLSRIYQAVLTNVCRSPDSRIGVLTS